MTREQEMDINVSDLHKFAYGVRPCMEFWKDWEKATLEEKETIYSNMVAALKNDEDEDYDYED